MSTTNTSSTEGAVTILFTDVEGSTDLRTRHGDEIADEVLATHERIVQELVLKHGGREVKALGDGFMVAFASPRKAISCAVDIQRSLGEHNAAFPDRELRVRIGLNTGEVVEKAGDLFGAAVNAAARIAGKARGGQILIANVVKDLAGKRPDLSYIDRGLFWLKGFPERWRLFEVSRQAETAAASIALAASGRTPFVGREEEMADVRRFVDQAVGGHGALVMIGGEPGVGKTRLTEEIAEEAARARMMAMAGHCSELEGAPPYVSIVEMLEASARGISRETLREALGDTASEVARIMPELRRLFPDLPPPLELPPEQERRYLFTSITEFLERASRMQPLLILLDDLHWADESTMLLIAHLAERLADMPVLILGTYRDVELDVSRPLARALEELHRRRLVHRVSLRRLSQEGVGGMLAALSGLEPPPSLVKTVYHETEGNAFFVEEVFRHLNEEGKLLDKQGRWLSSVEIGEVDVPEGVRLVIGRRLERLSETTRTVLAGAAIVGRMFPFELLNALDLCDPDALLDSIEEAQRARLILALEEGAEARFNFSHELVRQTLLSALSLPRRQRLHLRVGEAMAKAYGALIDSHAADMAHHLYQAGAAADPAKTARYLALAGDHAWQAAAFEDAHRHFEHALSLVPGEDRRASADLLVKLGFAQRSLERIEEAIATWRSALDLFADLGDRDAAANVCWEISLQLGWAGYPLEGMEFTQRGLAVLSDALDPLRGKLLALAGGLIGYLGDHQGATDMFSDAFEIARHAEDAQLDAYVRTSKAVVDYSHMELTTLVDEDATSGEVVRRAAAPWDLAGYLTLVQWALYASGRVDEGLEMADETLTLSDRIGHFIGRLLSTRMLGVHALAQSGDLAAFEAFVRKDFDTCRAADVAWITNSHGWLAAMAIYRGDFTAALEHARTAVDTEPPGGFNGWAWFLGFLANAHLGRREDALAMWDAVRGRLPAPGQVASWGSWAILHGAVEGLMLLGERETAAELYPLVQETPRTGAVFARVYDNRLTATIAGIAAHAAGRFDDATAHFEEALREAESRPARIEQAEARRYYAGMLAERDAPGDRERARSLAGEALEIYREAGMPHHASLVERALTGG